MRSTVLCWFCLLGSLLVGSACGSGGSFNGRKVVGGIEVKDEEIRGSLPQRTPRTIYVADFKLDAESYSRDQGVRGALPGRLGQRLPHPLKTADASERARQIVDIMAESLTQALRAKGTTAERLRDQNLPREGWLVQGYFTELDEGNRVKRAAIGFGRGATTMDLHVSLSDLAGADPRAAFAIFSTAKDPSHIPGALVTMNPYVAAAKFVLQKNATEKDIQTTAEQVAEQILKYEQSIR